MAAAKRRRQGSRPFIPGTNVKPRKVEIDGFTFDSQTEAEYYGGLRLRTAAFQASPTIRNIEPHKKFPLVVNGKKIGNGWYTLDFAFEEWRDGAWRQRYVEVKGDWDDRAGNLRRQLAAALHGIHIELIRR